MDLDLDREGLDEIHLVGIRRDRADESTRGQGARIIAMICALADSVGLPVAVEYERDQTGLESYYRRFGFAIHQDDGHGPIVNMLRPPTRP